MTPMGAPLREAAWMARCIGRGELAPFSDVEIARLADALGTRTVEAGAPLMQESDPVGAIGLILRGDVELTRRHGVRRVVLQVLHSGDVYGDIPFLCDMAPPFSARALTDAEVIEIGAESFWALLDQRPDVTRRFLFSVASRLQRMQQRLLELMSGDLRHQVASLLLDETGGVQGVVPLTQTVIAEMLGAGRSNVNRALKDLEGDGGLELGYRRIEVVDPSVLREILR